MLLTEDKVLERLGKLGLWGAGLVFLQTQALVRRYNDCLGEMGIEATHLEEFHIDGVGWSPEVAAEKDNPLYLSHGEANHFAIIMTPDQEKKPIYVEYTSYDRRLMRQYFARFGHAIADITVTTGIVLDFENGLSRYDSPQDLLLVDYIVARSSAGRLTEAAREQLQLRAAFDLPMGPLDSSLRRRIIEHSERHGDLRFRHIDIPDFQFDDLRSFYTRAFGGAFVLRTPEEEKDIVIVEDRQYAQRNQPEVHWFRNPDIIPRLMKEGFLVVDWEWYGNNAEAIMEKGELVLVEALCRSEQPPEFGKLSTVQKKRQIMVLGSKMQDVYFELEHVAKRLKRKGRIPPAKISPELELFLIRPHQQLSDATREVIQLLICKLQQVPDVLDLYRSDKNEFFRQYREWPDTKKTWAADRILGRYVPKMNQ